MDKQAGFFKRHRDFFLSWKTILTAFNGLLLLAGLIVSLVVGAGVGQWIYLASALVGGGALSLAGKTMPIYTGKARRVYPRP